MKNNYRQSLLPRPELITHLVCLLFLMGGWGCAAKPMQLIIKDNATAFAPGSIIAAKTGAPVTFETLMSDLATVQVIYVGEAHTSAAHHQIQQKVLGALYQRFPTLSVGMEMFDHSYQATLDQWSAGELEEKEFIQTVHWYANWRHNYRLYRDLLNFVKEKNIPLIGLNLPFHLPPKIAVGGLHTLSEVEKRHLPATIDLSDAAHREYVQKIFSLHRIPGRDDFENFYAAQCAWEDTMAEAIAENLADGKKMLVLAGNGHIIRKFGIPNRAYQRTNAAFRTIYPVEARGSIELSVADYIWVTPPEKRMPFGAGKHPKTEAK